MPTLSGHPAPFEARLLTKVIPTAVLAAPRERGVAVAAAVAAQTPSPAAALSRAAAIDGNPGTKALSAVPERVLNQNDLECCVSCALAGAMEVRYGHPPLGPIFHYHVTRFMTAGGADGQGRLFLDRGFGTLTAHGICREADHASVFTEHAAAVRPTQKAFADAVRRRIERDGLRFRYQQLAGTSRAVEVRRQIRENHPVVITFTLPMGYPGSFLNGSHEWLDERTPAASGSRHCVLVVAFDDARAGGRGAVRILDSQGPDKFYRGLWWMAYRVLDSAVVHESYALT